MRAEQSGSNRQDSNRLESPDGGEMEKKMEDEIRKAYDEMNPTPEQEERMLAALQAAMMEQETASQTEAAADGTAFETTAQNDAARAGVETKDGEDALASSKAPSAKRGGFRAWKVVVPVAACLVLALVGVGVASLGSSAPVTSGASSSAPLAGKADAGSSAAMRTETEASAAPMNGMVAEADGYYAAEVLDGGFYDSYAYDQFNTEEYAAVKENGFISTRTRPLSTVSADVDTASYCNLRRLVNEGAKLAVNAPDKDDGTVTLDGGDNDSEEPDVEYTDIYGDYYDPYGTLNVIPTGAVRVEEMLNYFTYNYEKPSGDDLFKVQAEMADCPWNDQTKLLVLGFATPYETQAADKGANLVFLIDVSGSMDSPDKLDLLKDSFTELLANLDGNDRVSIVTYSGQEEVVLEGARGDDSAQIMRAIYKLDADGSTNGEAGLRMAYDVAQRNFIEGGVNRIVMASDGDLNVGMTSESDLFNFVSEKRDTGIYLSVLGFGSGNYKDTKMETLADNGNGSYHYIDCIEEANRVLSQNLMANLVPFADDVKLQVEFNPAQVKGYRLIGYENRALADEDFQDDTVDAGDVGPNSQFTVAYEIVPADSSFEVSEPELKYSAQDYAGSDSAEWLTCSLRYRAFADDAVHQQAITVDASDQKANPSDDWRFASAVIEFGMIASDSEYKGSSTVDSVETILKGMNLSDERAGFLNLVEKARG